MDLPKRSDLIVSNHQGGGGLSQTNIKAHGALLTMSIIMATGTFWLILEFESNYKEGVHLTEIRGTLQLLGPGLYHQP